MGLAAPRKRVKLSNDPNNTKWSRDTTGFGQRILRSQGWQPGDYLGAKDAPHAEFHTAANASHIRIMLREDNLGIGAKRGGMADECTGLDVFQDLLGRLNGKSENELAKEEQSRQDLKRVLYTERRWGSLRFVFGGYLVGDEMKPELAEGDEVEEEATSTESSKSKRKSKKEKEITVEEKSSKESGKNKKKRKHEKEDEEETPDVEVVKSKKSKKQKKSEDNTSEESLQNESDTAGKERSKKDKKKRKSKTEDSGGDSDQESEAKREKKEKKKQKKEKSSKKESKEQKSSDSKSVKESKVKAAEESLPSGAQNSETSTPIASGASTPRPLMFSRHMVRSRNIAQKQLAVTDMKALNQIFMVKA